MAEEEKEQTAHLRPACVTCTFHCNIIHRDQNLDEEKYDPDRSWPYFRKKVSNLSVHQAPNSAICIPDAFVENYPHILQKGKVITLEGPSGNKWSVTVVNRSVLYSGWRAFAHDHRLREGDQLAFKLMKPLHFVVKIFNSHGDERRSAQNARVTGKYSVVPRLSTSLQDQSRKRKAMDTGMPIVGDRCKTTVKRGNHNVEYTTGSRLTFSKKKKQWERHEERDGCEVVDLDSDDEEQKGVIKRHEKSSKIDRLVEFMREEEENGIFPGTKPSTVEVVDLADNETQGIEESHEAVSGDGEKTYVAHEQQENDDSLDEEDQIASNPLRQFTTMFDTKPRKTIAKTQVETPMIKAKKGMLNSESNPLSRQAQTISCEEDKVMTGEEQEETYLPRVGQWDDMEVYTTKGTYGAPHVASSVSTPPLPNSSQQLHKFENRITVDCAHEQRLQPQSSDPHVENLNVISPTNILFSAMEAHEKTGSPNQGISEHKRNTASNEALGFNRIDPVMHEAADYEPVTNNANNDISPGMTSSISSPDRGEIELQVKRGNEVEVTDNQTALEEVTVGDTECTMEGKEIVIISDQAVSPDAAKEKEQNLNIQATPIPLTKSDTDTCVLMSKRGQVAQADRERALNLAQAAAEKLPNPNFIEVMKSTHVYTDFNMEIPSGFWKASKLPPTDVRVTLVNKDPPSNCKAIWMPGNDLKKSKLNAQGWMNFSRYHFLEEGDVCVFENLNNAGFRIRVYIFRVVELEEPIVLDWERHYKVLKTSPAGAQTHITNQARETNGGETI